MSENRLRENSGDAFLASDRYMRHMAAFNVEQNKDVVIFNNLVDVTVLENLRQAIFFRDQAKPSYTALLVKAVALALRETPEANCLLLNTGRVRLAEVDATVAVEREVAGLGNIVLTARINQCDRLDVAEITRQLRHFATTEVESVREWRDFLKMLRYLPTLVTKRILRLPLYSSRLWKKWRGGSFAITSPAKYGVDSLAAVWPYPLTFAFGLIKERPVVADGLVVAHRTMPLTLAWDRRLMPGAPAARFFSQIAKRLETANLGKP